MQLGDASLRTLIKPGHGTSSAVAGDAEALAQLAGVVCMKPGDQAILNTFLLHVLLCMCVMYCIVLCCVVLCCILV